MGLVLKMFLVSSREKLNENISISVILCQMYVNVVMTKQFFKE